jgi:hypothetical protein
MGTVRRDVVDVVCRALEAAGDPDRAKGQQAYMKSAMPFRGITSHHLKSPQGHVATPPGRSGKVGLRRRDRRSTGRPDPESAHSGTSAADWGRRTVDQLDVRLSPLSRREALKNLG